MLIVGIDPGYTSGGLVLIKPELVLATKTLRPTKDDRAKAKAVVARDSAHGDKSFTAATIIAVSQAKLAKETLLAWQKEYGDFELIAIESFIDQRSRAREEKAHLLKERWKTPLMIGALLGELEAIGMLEQVVWQDAGRVIRQFRSEIDAIAKYAPHKRDAIMKGDHQLKNDHLRKAWAHAAWRQMRI